MMRLRDLIGVCMLSTALLAAEAAREEPYYVYDPAEYTVEATLAENPEFYEIDITAEEGTVWATWLEFHPGRGDVIWLGKIEGDTLNDRALVVDAFGRFRRPRVTVTPKNQLYVSYEAEVDGQWDIFALPVDTSNGKAGEAIRVSNGAGPDINHRTAIGPQGRVWFVWQSTIDGKFQIVTRRMSDGRLDRVENISGEHEGSAWAPDIVHAADGRMVVCWDAYDRPKSIAVSDPKALRDLDTFDVVAAPSSFNFDIHVRGWRDGQWDKPIGISTSAGYEAQSRLAANANGDVFIAWEEGGRHWGEAYTSRMRLRDTDQLEVADDRGPLHRFRKLHVVRLGEDSTTYHFPNAIPMPSLEKAAQREGLREGVKHTGVYYERPVLTIDDAGRLWVFYRHRYGQYLGTSKKSHVEADWAIDARCFDGEKWSDVYRMSLGQGDGMQSLGVAVTGEEIVTAFTTGRTDRREADRPRGIGWGRLGTGDMPKPRKPIEAAGMRSVHRLKLLHGVQADSGSEEERQLAGKSYTVFFGDLHRHTDLSLCYVPYDGTIDEAYRYGSDVAEYDFLGITDHSRDIAMGDPNSQLWWRSVKEVLRHDLSPRFIPMYAYERSRGGEDHNVISLRADMLRPHTYPHPEFWKELDNDTITIPHQTNTIPFKEGEPQPRGLILETWDAMDNAHRPLIEIYQGCRHRAIEDNANEGLLRAHLLGFIASSDHLSTSHSYACVWAEQADRETIFRAMQQRRTYGATAKIVLSVMADGHWMGEKFDAVAMPTLDVHATGTEVIVRVDLIVDGEEIETVTPNAREIDLNLDLPEAKPGLLYAYVRLTQKDGHRAWSSPIWIDLKPSGEARLDR